MKHPRLVPTGFRVIATYYFLCAGGFLVLLLFFHSDRNALFSDAAFPAGGGVQGLAVLFEMALQRIGMDPEASVRVASALLVLLPATMGWGLWRRHSWAIYPAAGFAAATVLVVAATGAMAILESGAEPFYDVDQDLFIAFFCFEGLFHLWVACYLTRPANQALFVANPSLT